MASNEKQSHQKPSIAELEEIITLPGGGFHLMPGRGQDEVIPGLFVGEEWVLSVFVVAIESLV